MGKEILRPDSTSRRRMVESAEVLS